jgi:hypothetical protein
MSGAAPESTLAAPKSTPTAVNADLSKAGNVVDAALKPKISVPIWALLAAFAVGQALALIFHV